MIGFKFYICIFSVILYIFWQDHLDQLIEYKMRDQLQSNSALISM